MSGSGSPPDDLARANYTPTRALRDGFASETGMLPRQRPILERAYEQTLPPLYGFEQFQGQNLGWASPNLGPPVPRYLHPFIGYVPGPQPIYRGLPVVLHDARDVNTNIRGIFIPFESLPPGASGYVGEGYQHPSIPGVNMAPPSATFPRHHELLPPFQPHPGFDLQQTDRPFAPLPIPPPPGEGTQLVGPAFNRGPLAPDIRLTAPVYHPRCRAPSGLQSDQFLDTRNHQSAGYPRDVPDLTQSDALPEHTPPIGTSRGTSAWDTPPRSIYTKDLGETPPKGTPMDTSSRATSTRGTSPWSTPSRHTPQILDRQQLPPMDPPMESVFGFGKSGTPATRLPLGRGEYPANFRPAQLPSPISPPRGGPLDMSLMGARKIPRAPPTAQSALARPSSSNKKSGSDVEVRDPLPEALDDTPEDAQPVEGESSGALRSGSDRNPDEETEKSEETDNTLCEEPAIKAGTCCELHARLKAVIPCQMSNKIRSVLKRTMRSERRDGDIFFQGQIWQDQSQSQVQVS